MATARETARFGLVGINEFIVFFLNVALHNFSQSVPMCEGVDRTARWKQSQLMCHSKTLAVDLLL